MLGRRFSTFVGLVIAVVVATVGTIVGASVTSGGVTLTYPDYVPTGPPLASCEPWEEATAKEITLTGVPLGSQVIVQFTFANTAGTVFTQAAPISFTTTDALPQVVSVPYPADTSQWPDVDPVTNVRTIIATVAVRITTPTGTLIRLSGKKWWIRCSPPTRPNTGCTLGYWKQEHHFDSWPAAYAPTNDYNAIFGVTPTNLNPHTLLDALEAGGGGQRALARQSTAAILNASHPDINYPLTVAQIIAGVQDAYYVTGDYETFKDLLDAYNNAGCPLN